MPAIQTESLTRRFGDVLAVDDLSIEIEDGEIYGFLGPNGAGKSTTINMLLGYTTPSAGAGTILGYDIERDSVAIRQRAGILPENFGVYDRLTARKHLRFAVDTKDAADDPVALLERVGLADAIDRKAGGFSTGMKQRLALAIALVGEPDLLVLDEPSSGLDPNGAREMRHIIAEENERGATIFFSSHILDQVEATCDRVGILRDGRMVAEDSIRALKRQVDADTRLILTVDEVTDDALAAVRRVDAVSDVAVEGADIVVSLRSVEGKSAAINAVEGAGPTISDIRSEEVSLEELFAQLTTGPAAEVSG